MKNDALAVTDLTICYGKYNAIEDLSFSVLCGTLTSIIGPNGAGKSTLLKSILGFITPKKGKITIYGDSFNNRREAVAYIPQRSEVSWDFPASVSDIVCMGFYRSIGFFRPVSKYFREKSRYYLAKLEIEDLADRHIGTLSGGQQQRLFLARALAQEASLYLLDEPFNGIDARSEKTILRILNTLKDEGKAIICVHHDLLTANSYFTHSLLLNRRRIAAGLSKDVLTAENLMNTYGILPQIAENV